MFFENGSLLTKKNNALFADGGLDLGNIAVCLVVPMVYVRDQSSVYAALVMTNKLPCQNKIVWDMDYINRRRRNRVIVTSRVLPDLIG